MMFHQLCSGGGFGGHGWTYADVAHLTMPQLRNELNKGKKDSERRVTKRGVARVLADIKAGKYKF